MKNDLKLEKEKNSKLEKDLLKQKTEKAGFANKSKKLEATIKKLEKAVKDGFIELDKQVQLKEKDAEEKKMLREIINTHIKLKSLKKDLGNVLNKESKNGEVKSTSEVQENDSDWEDVEENIDSNSHEFEPQ